MSIHRAWKTCLGIIFLLAIMCLVMQPAFAAGQSKNKEKNKIATSPETPTPISQNIETILTYSSGPPIRFGPGWYFKVGPG